MPSGRSNNLMRQVGEHLVCAELGRRGFTATPFSGNVPTFDVLATDEQCRTVPIQVKASSASTWRSQATDWMDIELREDGRQHFKGPLAIANPSLIYVCVFVAPPGAADRFFVLTKADLQEACIKHYVEYMEPRGWRRARKTECFECRYPIEVVAAFEDNWNVVAMQLAIGTPMATLD